MRREEISGNAVVGFDSDGSALRVLAVTPEIAGEFGGGDGAEIGANLLSDG